MQLTLCSRSGKNIMFWDRIEKAHHYRIMAMTQTFVYLSIATTQENKYEIKVDKNNSYICFKIIAESEYGNVLDESNEVDASYQNLEYFEIAALNGYNGTTLTFRSKGVYDLYKVYDKSGLVAETEDPVLELLHKITKTQLNEIVVEGYIKNDEGYVLGGISEGIAKLPDRKKSDYKISVVIPVYNSEIFLPRTIDSILSSSMPDIEIILVNDGSKDNSLDVCKWYAKNFPCVSFTSQENHGLAIARNAGMKLVNGGYIGFVDSDDIIHPFMYENLYNVCKSEKVDIAIAVTVVHADINKKEFILDMPTKKEDIVVYTYDEMINNMGKSGNIYFVSPCNKIVKREIAEQLEFPTNYPGNVVLYEDIAYTPALYSYADKLALCKDAYYIWDKRQRKTVGTLSTRHKNDTDNVRKAFIYASSYPFYNRSKKHKTLCDYVCFKRIIKAYDKFKTGSPLLDYWNEKLRELIKKEKLMENEYIMEDEHFREIIRKLK